MATSSTTSAPPPIAHPAPLFLRRGGTGGGVRRETRVTALCGGWRAGAGARPAGGNPGGVEEDRGGPADQQADEGLGIGEVDRDLREERRSGLARVELPAGGLDERGEQRDRGDDGRADREPLGDGL